MGLEHGLGVGVESIALMEEGPGPRGQRRTSTRIRTRERAQLDECFEQFKPPWKRAPRRRRSGALA